MYVITIIGRFFILLFLIRCFSFAITSSSGVNDGLFFAEFFSCFFFLNVLF